MTEQNDTHRMGRRNDRKEYRWPGIYHITIQVKERQQQVLSRITGNPNKEDGDADAPRVELTAIGRMVEEELTRSITAHYPMIEVQDYVIMPEHLHFIVVVHRNIISKNGRETHLGQVIAGFKKGCNCRYWELIGMKAEGTFKKEQETHKQQGEPAGARIGTSNEQALRHAVHPHGKRPPSTGTTNRPPLFAYGYVDVMPLQPGQRETQRQYIHNNPRSRLIRTHNRECLQPHRGGIDTALKLPALQGFLQRECGSFLFDEEKWGNIQKRLLITDGMVTCDSYGNRQLLQCPLLPVVCHRKDKASFLQQQQRCLSAAAKGAILVSPRIAKGEQEIIDAAINEGYPVITIEDNGFPNIYHPSERRINLCATDKLLIITPWRYTYRHANDSISVAECKTMNCVAQALCHTKDSWWKM